MKSPINETADLLRKGLKIPLKIVKQIGYLPTGLITDPFRSKTKRRGKKAGLPPGSLVHVGQQKIDQSIIEVIDYSQSDFKTAIIKDPDMCKTFRDSESVSWINLTGIHDVGLIKKIGEMFELHPLLLEDILNTTHRPKVEDYGDYLFVTLKMLKLNPEQNEVRFEHLSFILGDKWVISFQEEPGDVFDPVRERIKEGKGKARFQKTDYLLYVLVDTVVDNYYDVVDYLGDRIESLESEILTQAQPHVVPYIQAIKRDLIFFRKAIFPVREVVSGLQKAESTVVKESTVRYFSDVYDHVVQVMESIEIYWEMTTNLMDAYYASLSNKMNEVMKVLTIMATLFIPLTFVAGIYGMNFEYMPELQLQWGYPAVWVVLITTAVAMLFYFRRKKWL